MEDYNVIILGGGIAGLTCAYKLSKKGKKVLLLEKEKKLGGMLKSFKIKNYFIEEFYHHVFPKDKFFISLLDDLGLKDKLYWKDTRNAFFYNNQFFELFGIKDLIKFKPFSILDKINFCKLMVKIKLTKDLKKLDNKLAKDYIIKNGGKRLYKKLFYPMLNSKFGDNLDNISAGWFVRRISLRSGANKNGERLGYVRGGFQQVIEKLSKEIEKSGGKIIKNSQIKKIINKNKKFNVAYSNKKSSAKYLISTIPPMELVKLISFKKDYIKKIKNLKYQGALCILLGLKKSISSKHYWTTLIHHADLFGAIIEHTNYIPVIDYQGDNIVYLASYPNLNSKIWEKTDKEIFDIYFKKLKDIFKNINDDDLIWYKIAKTKYASLIYNIGIYKQMPEVIGPIENLYQGGMFNSYPERSLNKSVKIGLDIAKKILEK